MKEWAKFNKENGLVPVLWMNAVGILFAIWAIWFIGTGGRLL